MSVIEIDVSEGVAAVTINRPDVHNAMDWDVFDGLAKAFDEVAGQPEVRALLVTGAGPSFSSGIDLNLFAEVAGDPVESIARAQTPYRKLATLDVPTVAAIRGHAYGAGLQLALCCDVRIAASDARLGLLEIRYGLIPDLGATALLARAIGPSRAKSMMWTGRKLDATEAERVGLVERVAAPGDLEREVREAMRALAEGPPLVNRAIKKLVDASRDLSFDDAMDAVALEQQKVLAGADFAEAIAAFVEKRSPRFTGR